MKTCERAGIRPVLLLGVSILFLFAAVGSPRADSIWNKTDSRPSPLYSTTKSEYKIGDIITILIVQDLRANNTTGLDTEKESDLQLQIEGFDDLWGLSHVFGQRVKDDPNFNLSADSEFDSGATSRRSSSITGTITGQVTEILPNGNLRLEASQTVAINGEANSVILVGTIRPADISPRNTVLSTHVSNAEIRYAGKGPLSNVQKRGVIKEFLEFIWPF